MICMKFTAFCDLWADLRIRLATLRKSVRKFWFYKLALTWVNLRVILAGLKRALYVGNPSITWCLHCICGHLTGKPWAPTVLGVSSTKPTEIWTQPTNHVWSRPATATHPKMYSGIFWWRTPSACSTPENIWEAGFPSPDPHCAKVQRNRVLFYESAL